LDRVGIAKVTMHQREYTVFIAEKSWLTVTPMYFSTDSQVEGYGKITQEIKLRPPRDQTGRALVESLSEDFNPQAILRHIQREI